MRNARTLAAVVVVGAVSVMMAGCRVDTHKEGDHENVKIATPFGGLSVKTDGSEVQQGVGLSAYPGAVPVKKQKDHDSGAADFNMNFGSFHLGVKALSYQTSDQPDKVLAFYRQDMARYGVVILCHHDRPVGTPTSTQDGLTCDDNDRHEVKIYKKDSSDGDGNDLKAGSKRHQHIVGIEPKDGGTKIGLVSLDLPGHVDFDSEGDKDKSDRQ